MLKPNGIHADLKVGNAGPTVKASLQVNGPISAGGTSDYERLRNKPAIENVELVGNKSFEELGLEGMENTEILKLFNEVFK